jgi:Transcription factor WhiB
MRVTAPSDPIHTALRPAGRVHRPVPSRRRAAAIRAARLRGGRVPAPQLSGRDLRLVLAEFGACTRLECPDDMFPDPDDAAAVQRAMTVCQRCPVRAYCGERARRTGSTYGVWAGRLLDGAPYSADHGEFEEEVTPAS